MGLPIYAVTASPLDLTTTDGRMQARIAGAVAQHEVEHKGERRARSAEQKAARGLSNTSTRGFGFAPSQVIKSDDGTKQYVYRLDEAEAVAIRKAADALLRGKSAGSIWREWNARGLRTPKGNAWDGTTFRNMMKRPALAGIATYKGDELPGVKAAWPAILKPDTWRAVMAILEDPARRTSPGNQPKYLASGVTYCECGAKMKSATNSIKSKRTGEVRNFKVYQCSKGKSGHASIKMELLDTIVYEAVIDALWRSRDKPVNADAGDDERLVAIELELGEVAAREARLVEAYTLNIVSKAAGLATSAKIAEDRAKLEAERDAITRSLVSDDAGEAWAAFWEGLDLSEPVDFDKAATVDAALVAGGRALVAAMVRGGMDADEARGKLAMEERFDRLPLDQQRALIASHTHLIVYRSLNGQGGGDRVGEVSEGKVKELMVKLDEKGDSQLTVTIAVDDKRTVAHELAVTDKGAPWINNFLEGVGADRKSFWGGEVTVGRKRRDGSQPVLKIGNLAPVGRRVTVATNGDRAVRFLP